MAQAINNLEKLQFGKETTPGTLVAADTVIVSEGGGDFQPAIGREPLEEPQGILALIEDIDVSKGTTLVTRSALDFEQLIVPLGLGLDADNPSENAGVYTRTVSPGMTAPDALDSGTFEVSYTDGSTRHLQVEFGHAQCRRFVISAAYNQKAMLEAEYFGRAVQSSTFTASQSPMTRELIPANKFAAKIDTSWASLGTTAKAGLVKEFEYEVVTGVEPDYALDARSDLDFTHLKRGPVACNLRLKMVYDANGDAEFDAWAAKTKRFVSLEAAGSSSRSLKLQVGGIYAAPPRFSVENGIRMMEATLAGRYDVSGAALLNIILANGIAAL